MGLIADGGEFVTLTDILGAEDALGDMDFKVAGTRDMITALQLDTKIESLPAEVLIGAMDQARDARFFILDEMERVIAGPRSELAPNAPKIEAVAIPKDKIGEVRRSGSSRKRRAPRSRSRTTAPFGWALPTRPRSVSLRSGSWRSGSRRRRMLVKRMTARW